MHKTNLLQQKLNELSMKYMLKDCMGQYTKFLTTKE